MCFQDHADIIGSIADSKGYRVLLRSFDELHNLWKDKNNPTLVRTFGPGVYLYLLKYLQFSHLCFLKRCHATAEHSATVATDL